MVCYGFESCADARCHICCLRANDEVLEVNRRTKCTCVWRTIAYLFHNCHRAQQRVALVMIGILLKSAQRVPKSKIIYTKHTLKFMSVFTLLGSLG